MYCLGRWIWGGGKNANDEQSPVKASSREREASLPVNKAQLSILIHLDIQGTTIINIYIYIQQYNLVCSQAIVGSKISRKLHMLPSVRLEHLVFLTLTQNSQKWVTGTIGCCNKVCVCHMKTPLQRIQTNITFCITSMSIQLLYFE